MKKNTLIAFLIAIGMVSCSEDECNHNINNIPDHADASIIGSWYEEEENEEIRHNENGTLYDCYANYVRCRETEGRWEYDSKNSKLTHTYSFMGQMQFVDWTVKNLTEFGYTISSSTVADHKLEKIVENYDLEVGNSVKIEFSSVYPDYPVISYTSNNERIASVTSDGTITAEGEKGITYIKIATADFNVWVKITVGDNCADLWYDYIGLLGMDYNGMCKALSRLGQPISLDGGYTFGYEPNLHDVIDVMVVELCPEDGMVTSVALKIKESVSEVQILSYMDSRYYKIGESGPFIYYSSEEDQEGSKAIIPYNKNEKIVLFKETMHFLHYPHVKDLWTDFVPLFGSDKDQVKKAMDGYGYPFLMSDFNYSKDGSDYYSISANQYAQMVGFVFNPDKQVSEFWVYMNIKSDANDVYNYLQAKYKENESENTEYTFVFYNDEKSMKVTFDLVNAAVIYNKVTMKQHESNNEILGNYYEAIDKTRDQIIAQFGAPISEDGYMLYLVGTEYVDGATMFLNEDTDLCDQVALVINENVAYSTIIEYLNSKYTVFANLTLEDGSQYAWTDGSSLAESKYGIVYLPAKRLLSYQSLSSSRAKSKAYTSFGFNENSDLFRIIDSKTKLYFDSIKKNKESIIKIKSQHLKSILDTPWK